MLDAVAMKLTRLLFTFLWCTSAPAFAADAPRPVQTTIRGVITLQGKPLSNKPILSCEDGRSSLPDNGIKRACASPIRTTTNQRGEFSFKQTGGVLPSDNFSPVADPRYSYWFEVQDGRQPKWFMAYGLGWAWSEIDLRCEMRPPRSPGETQQQYRERDLLECKVQRSVR